MKIRLTSSIPDVRDRRIKPHSDGRIKPDRIQAKYTVNRKSA